MEKLSKEKINEIAKNIFDSSDIIGKHGTSVANALSILETGFYFDKTSMVIQTSKDITALCSYGWKNNRAGDATNVIIALPKLFIKMLKGMNANKYEEWIKMIYTNNYGESMLIGVSSIVETRIIQSSTKTIGNSTLAPISVPYTKRHIPRELIKGFFAFCDGKTYRDFLSKPEEALEHLTYFENPHYFDNLSLEEQEQFVEKFCEKKKQHTR